MILLTTTLFFSFIFSFILTGTFINTLKKYNVIDTPNHRSSHKTPTPRGGGIVIFLSQVLTWPYLFYYFDFKTPMISLLTLLGASLLLIYISFKDDLKSLSRSLRFICQFIAGFLILFSFPDHILFFQNLFPFWIDRVFILFLFIGWVNIFNFMDGIDGITGQQTIIMCCVFSALFYVLGQFDFSLYSLNLACAVLGFLIWNWHPARIFLGDVGSIFLGLVTGWFILHFLSLGEWQIALIMPAYYYADGGITILKRLYQRKNIFKPHQEHFYQMPVHQHIPASTISSWIAFNNFLMALIIYLGFFMHWVFYLLSIPTLLFILRKLNKLKK